MYSDLTPINKMQFSRIFCHHFQIFDLRVMLLYYLHINQIFQDLIKNCSSLTLPTWVNSSINEPRWKDCDWWSDKPIIFCPKELNEFQRLIHLKPYLSFRNHGNNNWFDFSDNVPHGHNLGSILLRRFRIPLQILPFLKPISLNSFVFQTKNVFFLLKQNENNDMTKISDLLDRQILSLFFSLFRTYSWGSKMLTFWYNHDLSRDLTLFFLDFQKRRSRRSWRERSFERELKPYLNKLIRQNLISKFWNL